ncbi:MAG: DUF29 family protein, partial [Cyanobacteria bacterium P01_G01_bin.49]
SNTGNWLANIKDLQERLSKEIEANPHIYDHLKSRLDVIYDRAIKELTRQSNFKSVRCPFECPYTLSQVISG